MQLVAENLVLKRGGRTIINGLSFQLGAGQALLLTGANGSGKTTLLRSVAGFLKPFTGELRADGLDDEQELGELCHFVGHLDGNKPHLTVMENAAFYAGYLGGLDASRAQVGLKKFALAELADIPAAYLSAGQKRRLALARLVATPRPIWLLDEPTVSLDTASVALLVDAVNAHLATGGIVVAATHLPLAFTMSTELNLDAQGKAA